MCQLCAWLLSAIGLLTVPLVKAEEDPATTTAVTGEAALLKPAPSGMTSSITPGAGELDRDAALKAAARDRVDTRGEFYEQPIRLYDTDGRLLEARLVSAAGDVITVERSSDKKQFQVPLEKFHDLSQRYIKLWLQRDVEAIDYSLGFVARKRMLEDSDYETAGRTLTTTKWVYDIELTNRTRNELEGAEIEFRIFYDDEVKLQRTTAYPGEGIEQDGESVALPTLGFNARAEFTTPPIELDTYRYDPTRGEREYRKDQLVGIWLRVAKGDDVIAEHKSNETAMKDFVWDGEETTVIKVTDSFGDEFKDSKRIDDGSGTATDSPGEDSRSTEVARIR
jgi:hypothetical protein